MDDETYFLNQIPDPKPPRFRAKKISSLVSRVMNKYGIESQQAASQLQQAWKDAAGANVSCFTRVGNIQRGSLYVGVANNLVLQELSMRKRELLQAIKLAPGCEGVRDLKFRLEHFQP